MSKVWRFLKVRRSVSDIPEKIFGYTWLQVFETITVKGFSDIIGKWNAFTWKGFHPIKKEEKTISRFWKKESYSVYICSKFEDAIDVKYNFKRFDWKN